MARKPAQDDRSWAGAVAVAVAILVALWLALGLIPSRLTTFLDERGVGPRLRDVVVAFVFTTFFVGILWVLATLQRKGRI